MLLQRQSVPSPRHARIGSPPPCPIRHARRGRGGQGSPLYMMSLDSRPRTRRRRALLRQGGPPPRRASIGHDPGRVLRRRSPSRPVRNDGEQRKARVRCAAGRGDGSREPQAGPDPAGRGLSSLAWLVRRRSPGRPPAVATVCQPRGLATMVIATKDCSAHCYIWRARDLARRAPARAPGGTDGRGPFDLAWRRSPLTLRQQPIWRWPAGQQVVGDAAISATPAASVNASMGGIHHDVPVSLPVSRRRVSISSRTRMGRRRSRVRRLASPGPGIRSSDHRRRSSSRRDAWRSGLLGRPGLTSPGGPALPALAAQRLLRWPGFRHGRPTRAVRLRITSSTAARARPCRDSGRPGCRLIAGIVRASLGTHLPPAPHRRRRRREFPVVR